MSYDFIADILQTEAEVRSLLCPEVLDRLNDITNPDQLAPEVLIGRLAIHVVTHRRYKGDVRAFHNRRLSAGKKLATDAQKRVRGLKPVLQELRAVLHNELDAREIRSADKALSQIDDWVLDFDDLARELAKRTVKSGSPGFTQNKELVLIFADVWVSTTSKLPPGGKTGEFQKFLRTGLGAIPSECRPLLSAETVKRWVKDYNEKKKLGS